MKSQSGIYRWSKILRSESEVSTWEAVIEASGLTHAMISHNAGRKNHLLEIFDALRAELLGWQKQFGGELDFISAAKLEAMSQPPSEEEVSLLKIRDRLVVSQTRDKQVLADIRKEYPGRIILSYPPGLAFGTGDHATTATCLRQITDFAKQRARHSGAAWDFLDLGCGSGILSAAANALGADRVLGIDFDEMAVRTAHRLSLQNGLDEACLIEADVLKWKPQGHQTYDLIAANIFHDVLIEVFPRLPAWSKPGAELIVSGILNSQERNCLRAGEKAGFEFDRIIRRGKWSTAHGLLSR
ncbi:MAG: methyltransferase domain-containing protein [Verrucomicrobia bacterium]|nr:methyltransferase domain-containing protein [Verrucomicrobiota bacterium]